MLTHSYIRINHKSLWFCEYLGWNVSGGKIHSSEVQSAFTTVTFEVKVAQFRLYSQLSESFRHDLVLSGMCPAVDVMDIDMM